VGATFIRRAARSPTSSNLYCISITYNGPQNFSSTLSTRPLTLPSTNQIGARDGRLGRVSHSVAIHWGAIMIRTFADPFDALLSGGEITLSSSILERPSHLLPAFLAQAR
jgi:hypothetical protein